MRAQDGGRVIDLYAESRDFRNLPENEARLLEQLVARVRAEFLEMPGLRLTVRQARRFWGLEERLCDTILLRLVEARFLRRTHDGFFARHDAA